MVFSFFKITPDRQQLFRYGPKVFRRGKFASCVICPGDGHFFYFQVQGFGYYKHFYIKDKTEYSKTTEDFFCGSCGKAFKAALGVFYLGKKKHSFYKVKSSAEYFSSRRLRGSNIRTLYPP